MSRIYIQVNILSMTAPMRTVNNSAWRHHQFFPSTDLDACVQHHAHMSQVSNYVKLLHGPCEGSVYSCCLRLVLSNNVIRAVFCWTTLSWPLAMHRHLILHFTIRLLFKSQVFRNCKCWQVLLTAMPCNTQPSWATSKLDKICCSTAMNNRSVAKLAVTCMCLCVCLWLRCCFVLKPACLCCVRVVLFLKM